MHSELFHLGPLPVYSYGVSIMIGFLVALKVGTILSNRVGIDEDIFVSMSLYAFIVGFLGTKVLGGITQIHILFEDPMRWLDVREWGLVFYGGPLAGVPFGIWYTRRRGVSVWEMLDIVAPCIAVAHAFGRIGCFLAGCCHGIPTKSVFGVTFPANVMPFEYKGIPVHPTQLYEAASLFALFFLLMWLFKRRKFIGQVFFSYVFAYAIIRSLIEIVRGDDIRMFVIEGILSTSQFISVVVALIAFVAMRWRIKSVNSDAN